MPDAKPICIIYLHRNIEITSRIYTDLEARLPDYHVFTMNGTEEQRLPAKFTVYNASAETSIEATHLRDIILESLNYTNLNPEAPASASATSSTFITQDINSDYL